MKHRIAVSILITAAAVIFAAGLLAIMYNSVQRAFVTEGELSLSDASLENGMVLICNPYSEPGTMIHTFYLTIEGDNTYCFYMSDTLAAGLSLDGQPAECQYLGRYSLCLLAPGTHTVSILKASASFLSNSDGSFFFGTMDQAMQMYQHYCLYNYLLIVSSLFAILFAISLFLWKRSESYLLFFALHAAIACVLGSRFPISQSLTGRSIDFLSPLPVLDPLLGAAGNYSLTSLAYALLTTAIHWMVFRVFLDDRIGERSYIQWILLCFAACIVAIFLLRNQPDVLSVSYVFYFTGYVAEGYVLLHNEPHLRKPEILAILQVTWGFSLVFWLFRAACNYGYISYFPYGVGGVTAISYTIGFLLAINGKFSMKFAEAELLSNKLSVINETLEKRVEEKTRSLKESYVQIEAAQKSRNEFMSNMIHNMKTPLFSLNGYAEILRSEIGDNSNLTRKYVDLVCNNAAYLQQMLKQLLLSNRLEEKSIDFQHLTFNIVELIRRVISSVLPTARERRIRLEFFPHQSVILYDGDDFYLQQAIQNILDNAILHSGDGEKILIECGTDENIVWIRITDYGEGIPEEVLPHIMERCFSYHPYGEKSSGLGLTISQEIVNAHGGSIQVESCVNEGSSFTIILPVHQEVPER